MEMLKVGDTVLWRDSWGAGLRKEAIVESIDICENGSKHGVEVNEVDWQTVQAGREIVVSLTNGSWAYGFQLEQLK